MEVARAGPRRVHFGPRQGMPSRKQQQGVDVSDRADAVEPTGGGSPQQPTDDTEPVRWARWLQPLPEPLRYLVLVVLAVGLTVAMRAEPVREWLTNRPWLVAIPLLILGLAAVIVGAGPTRWIEKEVKRANRSPLIGARAFARLPRPARRAFLVGGGLFMIALAVGGLVLPPMG